jgi:hypothetical protein
VEKRAIFTSILFMNPLQQLVVDRVGRQRVSVFKLIEQSYFMADSRLDLHHHSPLNLLFLPAAEFALSTSKR